MDKQSTPSQTPGFREAMTCPACGLPVENKDGFGQSVGKDWFYCHNWKCPLIGHSFRRDQLEAIAALHTQAVEEAVRPWRELCRGVEWGGCDTCYFCGADKSEGHAPDCGLAILLGGAS